MPIRLLTRELVRSLAVVTGGRVRGSSTADGCLYIFLPPCFSLCLSFQSYSFSLNLFGLVFGLTLFIFWTCDFSHFVVFMTTFQFWTWSFFTTCHVLHHF